MGVLEGSPRGSSPRPPDRPDLPALFLLRRKTDRPRRTRALERELPVASRVVSRTFSSASGDRCASNRLSSPSQVPCHSSPSTQVTSGDKAVGLVGGEGSPRYRDPPDESFDSDTGRPRASLRPRRAPSRHRHRAQEWWRARGRSSDRSSGCGPRRSETGAGRRMRVPACAATSMERKRFPAGRVEGVQLVSGSKPDVLTVVGDATYMVDARKGTILTDNFGSRVASYGSP